MQSCLTRLRGPLALAFWMAVLSPTVPVEAGKPGDDSLIKPLLASKVDEAVCFAGMFEGIAVDVLDYNGGPAWPTPKGEAVTAMTLLVYRDDREHESWDEMHDFRLRLTIAGWPEPLESAGECPLRHVPYHFAGTAMTIPANTTALYCGIDCDGGGMGITRIAGTRDVMFRFSDGPAAGLRMSLGCSGGRYRVGQRGGLRAANEPGTRQPEMQLPDTDLPAARESEGLRLAPLPAADCAAFRKKTD